MTMKLKIRKKGNESVQSVKDINAMIKSCGVEIVDDYAEHCFGGA